MTTMRRRDWLTMAAATGAATLLPGRGDLRADESGPYEGPLYFCFNAIGGWDTTMLCDPKGTPTLNRTYDAAAIESAGDLRYAPSEPNRDFFQKYAAELLVLNGMDMASPNHAIGQRYAWTGKKDSKVYPAFGAVAAAHLAPRAPLAFMSFGEYDVTGGLVPVSRIHGHEQLLDVLDPAVVEGDPAHRYHDPFAAARIRAAVRERHERQLAEETLPRRRATREQLRAAQLGAEDLRIMRSYLPEQMPAEIDARGMRTAATLAVAAMQAGLCVSANFALPVFDTHDTNDAKQSDGLEVLLRDIDFAIEAATAAGLRDRLTVVVASDFGRTPKYNAHDGKDHWSVGSALVLGPGIRGGRVIGATNEGLEPMNVDPDSLEPLDPDAGIRLRPEHLHHALRAHAGVTDAAAMTHPLDQPPIHLFS
jgi:uncharacterized protein (DUF1501 family)